jgi:ribosomal protein S18 acetylase RimI-like enzyme
LLQEATSKCIREIESLNDPLWPAWKEIYLTSFPPNERMSLEYFENILSKRSTEEVSDRPVLVLSDEKHTEDVVGLAYCEMDADTEIAFLWYLATHCNLRGKGNGAYVYRDLVERARKNGTQILVFEVEIPRLASAKSPEDEEWARRRIGWYERQGAVLVNGIQYFQDVDSTDELTEMHIMVHLFQPMSAEQVYERLGPFLETR